MTTFNPPYSGNYTGPKTPFSPTNSDGRWFPIEYITNIDPEEVLLLCHYHNIPYFGLFLHISEGQLIFPNEIIKHSKRRNSITTDLNSMSHFTVALKEQRKITALSGEITLHDPTGSQGKRASNIHLQKIDALTRSTDPKELPSRIQKLVRSLLK